MTEPLWRLTAAELTGRFAAGAATPDGALASVLERLEAVNGRLNAVVTLDLPGARAAAAAATARWRDGAALGALDGVPVTVKDNIFVGGLRATWGSLLYEHHVAPRDDLPVAALRAAGAVILGKTNTPELAMSGFTDNRVFGSTGNPWDPALSPGGSSGGAVAAVGAGVGPIALATDAGGSIRRPSAHAGVAGLKPGIGRVPRRHGFPPLSVDLQVIGPIARSIADLRAAFAVMAAPGPAAPTAGRLRLAAFGTVGDAPVDPAVSAAFKRALDVLRGLDHQVEEIAAPWNAEEVNALFAALSAAGAARLVARFPDWRERVTPQVATAAEAGLARTAAQHVADLDALDAFRWRVADAFAGWDAVATPTAAVLAWPREQPYPPSVAGLPAGPRAAAIFATAVNLSGLPAVAVPAPVPAGALPAGLQLIGATTGAEERLLDLAAAYEDARPWPRLAPLP